MRILFSLLFVFSTTAFADVSKDEALESIDEMVKSNMISAEEAEKAKARLVTMKDEAKTNRAPASVTVADPSTDLGKEQLSAIENDLKAIAPHYTHVPKKSFLGM